MSSEPDSPSLTPATEGVAGVTTKLSRWSVPDTVARLSAVIAARGLKLFAVIDQRAEAQAVGLEMRQTQLVIFGSPKAGTPLMASTPLLALDLPLKVLVWEDQHETKLSYVSPGALALRHGLSASQVAPLAGIDGITDAVVDS